MRNLWFKLLAVAFVAAWANPAAAQATRTWVSGVGDDANPCSRTAPCKTFAGAISKTAAAGEINCLDPGGYGAVTITKSLVIDCSAGTAGVLVSGTNGININAAATDRVVLRGLDIEGVGTGLNGVNVLAARDVLIERSTIHGFRGGAGNGVRVASSVQVRVTLRNVTINSNTVGVSVEDTGVISQIKVYDSLILDNFSNGLAVDGATNDIEIINNRITGPVGLTQTNGGIVRSYGGNVIQAVAGVPSQNAATK